MSVTGVWAVGVYHTIIYMGSDWWVTRFIPSPVRLIFCDDFGTGKHFGGLMVRLYFLCWNYSLSSGWNIIAAYGFGKLIQSLFLQWFVKLMGPSLFLVYYFNCFFPRLIITCRLWVIYVREDNYSNV